MSQLRVCPACQYENSVYLVECRQCGAPLNTDPAITLPAIPTRFTEPIRHSRVPGQTWPPDALALYVSGEEAPIILQSQARTVLGRSESNEFEQRLDLTGYDAAMLGVSRRHAAISFSDEDCLLEDLGSRNGTWINGNRLVAYEPRPLQNGDVIQLGELILFVYFKDQQDSA